jgi:hypothetical protein
MPKFDSSIRQNLADEQPTVAIVRIPLAAHQGDAVAMRAVDQALDSCLERLLFGHRSVQRTTLGIVVLLVRRATPQLLSEEEIANAALSHRRLELVAVEVRRKARVWKGPHIDEELNPLSQNEMRKGIELVVRMAYGPDNGARRHRAGHGRDRR